MSLARLGSASTVSPCGWRPRGEPMARQRSRLRLPIARVTDRLGAFVFLSGMLASRAWGATFTVTSAGDGADAVINGVCADAGGFCTLRAAVQEANAAAGPHTINFNIPPAGAHTIVVGSAYPDITSRVTIDGTTQPGWVNAPPYSP